MNLLEIRILFAQESGRYDLINADNSDNGVDRFIQAGSRLLDRMSSTFREVSRVYRTLAAGSYLLTFKEARTISKVGLYTKTEFKGYLEEKSFEELKSDYPEPFDSISRAAPSYYSPAYLRLSDTQSSDYTGYSSWVDSADWNLYNGIILMPLADQEYLVEIWGKFFSETLSDDSDENFWSVREPQILIKAALRELEVHYRNTQGQRDWEAAIRAELHELEKDFVEDEYEHIETMGL